MSTIAPTVHQLPAAPPGLLRRSVIAVAILVALGLLASILTGTASAATVKRHVDPQPGSVLTIHDDESWPFDDVDEKFDMSSWYMGVLSPTRLTDEYGSSRCGGGEVRVNYQHRTELSLTSPGWVLVTLSAQMYEGASCFSNDLDGQASKSFWIAPGKTVGTTLTVRNDDEGGDYANLHFEIKNADWTLS